MTGERLEARMRAQTEAAIADADVVIFVMDARAGVTALDRTFADVLRRSGKPVVVAANKCEGMAADAGAMEAYSLGLGDPVQISAEHALGMADLADAVREKMALDPRLAQLLDEELAAEDESEEEAAKRPLRIAVVARPNVGKSTLINTLLGQDRLITGPEAGITRDTIAVPFSFEGRAIELYDTAGMRRRARVNEKLEKLSVMDTLNAIKFADIVIVMMEAQTAFDVQDLQIAHMVEKEGRAIVLAVNKWDLVEERSEALASWRSQAERLLPQIKGVILVPLSGHDGRGHQAPDEIGVRGRSRCGRAASAPRRSTAGSRPRSSAIRRRPSKAAASASNTSRR